MATIFDLNVTGTGNVDTLDSIDVGTFTFDEPVTDVAPPGYSNCTCDSCITFNREERERYETAIANEVVASVDRIKQAVLDLGKQANLGLVTTIDDLCVSRKCRAKKPVHFKHNITKTEVKQLNASEYRPLQKAGGFNIHRMNQTCVNCKLALIPTDVDSDICNDCMASLFGHPMRSNIYDYFTNIDINAMRNLGFAEGSFYSFDCRCKLCDDYRILRNGARAGEESDYPYTDHENWYGITSGCRDCGENETYPAHIGKRGK